MLVYNALIEVMGFAPAPIGSHTFPILRDYKTTLKPAGKRGKKDDNNIRNIRRNNRKIK